MNSTAKVCRGCGEEKPLSEYHRRRAAPDGRQRKCKQCATALVVQWQRDNPERHRQKQRRSDLKRQYGLSEAQYNDMLEKQGGACAICGVFQSPDRPLNVDHCHMSGRVRGLLCWLCNAALGRFKDDTDLLLKAAAYLDR